MILIKNTALLDSTVDLLTGYCILIVLHPLKGTTFILGFTEKYRKCWLQQKSFLLFQKLEQISNKDLAILF